MPARAEIHTAFPRYLTVNVDEKSLDDATRQKIQLEIGDAFAVTLLHGSASGRSDPMPSGSHAMRT
jgi:hypothetical protein